MISALQKAHPLLAGLLGSKSSSSSSEKSERRSGVAAKAGDAPVLSETQQAALASEQANQRVLQQFLEIAPERVKQLRKLFANVGANSDEHARQMTLGQLSAQVRVLWSICDCPPLAPVSKICQSLERLLTQSSEQLSSLTPSTLRTMAASIVLLESLCNAGVKPDLLSNPVPRFLNIDDDAICRQAVSLALQQAFGAPEHAEDGDAGMALVQQRPFDVIFLDVEMPGLNGFDVCSRIHQTRMNAHTPVVFVTWHHHFESRAKASASGGHDLIAKPFLPSELTLKTLTVLLRRRMQPAPALKGA
ncbi:MAG TPA: response regulator [Candidatus Dormibacteraeota bacterium]|nr:response regulator [Candidatus Dormibacteraeota bacterium]